MADSCQHGIGTFEGIHELGLVGSARMESDGFTATADRIHIAGERFVFEGAVELTIATEEGQPRLIKARRVEFDPTLPMIIVDREPDSGN